MRSDCSIAAGCKWARFLISREDFLYSLAVFKRRGCLGCSEVGSIRRVEKSSNFLSFRSGSLKLPRADWMSPEFAPGRSLDSAGMILLGDPQKDGLAQAVEVTGLRAEYTPAVGQS